MNIYGEFYWTLEQAVAWIALRERAPMELLSAQALKPIKKGDRIREYQRIHGQRMTPYFVACQNPLTKIFSDFPDQDIDNEDKYTRELLEYLRRGEISANAWLRREDTRRQVEPFYWLDHTIGCDECGLLSDRGPPPRHTSGLADVRIEAAAVRRRWPAPSPAVESAVSVREQAFERLCRMMEDDPEKQPAPKRAIHKTMQADVDGLSHPIFEEAWKAALKRVRPIGWAKSGRPKKE